jgi:hypothetical protein
MAGMKRIDWAVVRHESKMVFWIVFYLVGYEMVARAVHWLGRLWF